MDKGKEILVTPEYLKQKAKRIEELLKIGYQGYGEIESSARETENCLKGKCADRIRRKILGQTERGIEGLQSLEMIPEKLMLIAGEYETAEKENADG